MPTSNPKGSADGATFTATPPVWHLVEEARPLVALCGYRFTDEDSVLGGPGGSSPGAHCVVCVDLDELES